jgi:galactonate dehydratase
MKITKIETIHLADFPYILFVAVHTDEGLVGYGDTYYMTGSVREFIHEFAAPMLIGHDPRNIELHWKRIYEMIAHIVGKGAEMRGLSAIDVALWDIMGQAANMPIWQVLGGAARDRIMTYNTCGGPSYGRPTKGAKNAYGIPSGSEGKYEDLFAFLTDAGALAEDLVSEGLLGMKIWPFDFVAHTPGGFDNWATFGGWGDRTRTQLGGQRIADPDLDRCLAPFRQIRDAVGDKIEIMVEGHGFWSLPAAKKIAHALEPFNPAWLEDFMRADDVGALAELQRSTTIPVVASEYLTTRYEYKPVLEQRAADIIMIDPTWAGGITETKKICTMAETYKRPVAMHDCTGPFTLYAGIHIAINATNALYQESLRSYLRVTYPQMVTEVPIVEAGHILAPSGAGLGTTLLPEARTRPDATVRETVA